MGEERDLPGRASDKVGTELEEWVLELEGTDKELSWARNDGVWVPRRKLETDAMRQERNSVKGEKEKPRWVVETAKMKRRKEREENEAKQGEEGWGRKKEEKRRSERKSKRLDKMGKEREKMERKKWGEKNVKGWAGCDKERGKRARREQKKRRTKEEKKWMMEK